MKEKTTYINIINVDNPVRMGFFVSGHGIVTRVNNRQNTVCGIHNEIMKSLIAIDKRNKQ